MIKVNLLPHLKAKKAKQQMLMQYQLLLFSGFFAVLLGGLAFFWFHLDQKVQNLEGQKVALEGELNVLKQVVMEVEGFERDKRTFEEKINIIRQLRLNQSGPVRLLDQVSRSLPMSVWLINLSQKGNQVAVEGKALTNPVLVDFINQLKQSDLFSDVLLLESRQGRENDVPIYNFKLSCKMKI